MKKTLLRIVTACLFFIFLTAYSSNPFRGTVGNVAPNFKVENDLTTVELQKLKGKYVLLSFWNSVDAESRIANIQYDREVRALDGIDFVAVNFDSSFGVYQEILKNDELNAVSQFYEREGSESMLYARYELARGMKALLLDKTGKVVAENPSPEELKGLAGL